LTEPTPAPPARRDDTAAVLAIAGAAVGLVIYLLTINLFVRTGSNLGFDDARTEIVYAGIPIGEVVIGAVVIAVCRQRLLALLCVVWALNAANLLLGFFGVFGFY
jgi:hypothetical protein